MAHDLRPYLRADVTASTPSGALVVTCAALGSRATELARVVAVPRDRLIAAVMDGEPLDSWTVGNVARWLSCLWWRTLWRLGTDEGNDEREMDAVADFAATLPHVPDDFAADLARALILGERRDPGLLGRGELNHNSVLTYEAVESIRASRAAGKSIRQIARKWSVSASTVYACVEGRTW